MSGLSRHEVQLLDQMGSKGWTTLEVVSGRGPEGGSYRNVGARALQVARRLAGRDYATISEPRIEIKSGCYYEFYLVEMTPEGKTAWFDWHAKNTKK